MASTSSVPARSPTPTGDGNRRPGWSERNGSTARRVAGVRSRKPACPIQVSRTVTRAPHPVPGTWSGSRCSAAGAAGRGRAGRGAGSGGPSRRSRVPAGAKASSTASRGAPGSSPASTTARAQAAPRSPSSSSRTIAGRVSGSWSSQEWVAPWTMTSSPPVRPGGVAGRGQRHHQVAVAVDHRHRHGRPPDPVQQRRAGRGVQGRQAGAEQPPGGAEVADHRPGRPGG